MAQGMALLAEVAWLDGPVTSLDALLVDDVTPCWRWGMQARIPMSRTQINVIAWPDR